MPRWVSRAVRTRPSPSLRSTVTSPAAFERAKQPAQVARVESELRAKSTHVAAVPADLPENAGLAERPVEGEVVVLERADALGDQAVEAPHLRHRVHVSLILVRDRLRRYVTGRREPSTGSARRARSRM